MTLTMGERRERGETIINRRGVELVSAKVLAREALVEYDALIEEHNAFYRSHSPWRTDHASIDAAIMSDLHDKAEEIVSYVSDWLKDEALQAEQRAYAIARAAEIEEGN